MYIRLVTKIGIVFGLICLNMPVFAYFCSNNNKSGFAQVGDTMDQVQQQCGTPNLVETCTHQLTQITNTTVTTLSANTPHTLGDSVNVLNPVSTTNPTSTLGRTVNITVWQYDKGPNLPAVLIEFHNGRLFQAPLNTAVDPCSNS